MSSIPGLVLNTGLQNRKVIRPSEHGYAEDGAQRTVDGEMGPYPTGMLPYRMLSLSYGMLSLVLPYRMLRYHGQEHNKYLVRVINERNQRN